MDLAVRTLPSRADVAEAVCRHFLKSVIANRAVHLKIILDGRVTFLNTLRQKMAGHAIDDYAIELMWGYLWHRRGENPKQEFERLQAEDDARCAKEAAERLVIENLWKKARTEDHRTNIDLTAEEKKQALT